MTREELYALIVKTATEDERIRALTLEGSAVCGDGASDDFSDFDVTFFVTDIREFTKNKNYMDRFGQVLIVQYPDDWYAEPYDYNSRNNFAYLTQYKDGNRIDLTLTDISNIKKQENFDEPRRVILNKDRFPELKDITSDEVFNIRRPTEFEYYNTCNEFRWLSNYATKNLCRHQLFAAKHITDTLMMDMFLKMLDWKVGIQNRFSVSTGAHRKHLDRYLPKEEMDSISGIFSDGTYGNMWEKLFFFYDTFAELAKYVAEGLNFSFDETETVEVRKFMKGRQTRFEENK